jgi:hypothetical protein
MLRDFTESGATVAYPLAGSGHRRVPHYWILISARNVRARLAEPRDLMAVDETHEPG